MAEPEVTGATPLFIVRNVPATLAFYRDSLGFDIAFQGPVPDDIFFGIVRRGGAMIWFKDLGVDPVPNAGRNPSWALDAYIEASDPDALAAEFSARNIQFFTPLQDSDDGLRGFTVKDPDGYLLFFGCHRG
jgi:catechol 2,3-dioxygenase-like lactoylglutathione lyase family enzyme